jgi:hypothetical protein
MPFRNPAGRAGLLNNLVGLSNALVSFLESRFALFAAESRTALVHIVILAACVIGALVMLAFGYVFLLVGLLAALRNLLGISWLWLALGAAFLHFVLAFTALMIAKVRLSKPMFEYISAELKRDRAWLKNQDRRENSTT